MRSSADSSIAAPPEALPNASDPRDVSDLRDGLAHDAAWARERLQVALEAEEPWSRALFLGALRERAAWAWSIYYQWYHPLVERICRDCLLDSERARDCAADVSLCFLDRYVHTPRPLETFPGYLFAMARTWARHDARKRSRTSGGLDTSDSGPSAALEGDLGERRSPEALAIHLDELTLETIANGRGCSLQAVDGMVRRALKRLAACLGIGAREKERRP